MQQLAFETHHLDDNDTEETALQYMRGGDMWTVSCHFLPDGALAFLSETVNGVYVRVMALQRDKSLVPRRVALCELRGFRIRCLTANHELRGSVGKMLVFASECSARNCIADI